ncbi:restriction endonuclease subunit S [Dysosmobacter welbionis]|jgi:type I restriction enzyme S subunit|uniref:restriction endonuclease subunit S n=1 Tax=Dysosmobacter welbionis TaxID=2093857 RepID=UPI00210E243A|nr:restriction endonuclease subunit S [Dysosmobacter welbionis]MCQ5042433.1 restriction endonuclease subunit S [Dysosmobacter welbionis]
MKEGYRLLGDFIQPVDERNRDLKVDYLLGVSISKQFIPSIANIVGTDLSSYKIVRTGQFAYGPVTSRNGEKISIALLRDKDCIISSSYTVFEVVNKNALDPEYLMLWFSRPEFDRYARYMSHGSVREIFDWDELCKVELPVPSIDKQRSIVKAYQTITERIELKRRINDNLAAALSSMYKEFFTVGTPENLPAHWKIAPFSDIADVIMGQSPEGDDCNNAGCGDPLLNGPTEFGFYSPTPVQWTTNGKKYCVAGDLLFCVRGSTTGRMNWANQSYAIGRGLAAIRHKKDSNFNWFIKAMVDNSLNDILAAATGSTFPNIGKELLNGFYVIIPDETSLQKYGPQGYAIFRMITDNAKEIDSLYALKKTLLFKLTT